MLELLEMHASMDVVELTDSAKDIEDPTQLIAIFSDWAAAFRANDSTWGLLALELFRRARRDAAFGKRHSELFRAQWKGLGRILLKMFPKGEAPATAETLGALVCELTYGSASGFMSGAKVGELVKTVLTALFVAYGKR